MSPCEGSDDVVAVRYWGISVCVMHAVERVDKHTCEESYTPCVIHRSDMCKRMGEVFLYVPLSFMRPPCAVTICLWGEHDASMYVHQSARSI